MVPDPFKVLVPVMVLVVLGFIEPLSVRVMPEATAIDAPVPRVILPVLIIVVAPVMDRPPVLEKVPVPSMVLVAPLMVNAFVVPVIDPFKTRLPDKAMDWVPAASVPPTVNTDDMVSVPDGVSVLPLAIFTAAGLNAVQVCDVPPLK